MKQGKLIHVYSQITIADHDYESMNNFFQAWGKDVG